MAKLLVDGTKVFKLLPELYQSILLFTDVFLQHLHGQLHFLFHPDLHLQLLLHVLQQISALMSATHYRLMTFNRFVFNTILYTYKYHR